jgi:drug/metabolite transporter (DMT)-like permease
MRKNIYVFSLKHWPLWIAGFFAQALPFALLFYGEQYVAPALASIINSTVSIWSLVLGTLIFRDMSQWTPLKIIGLFVGLIGILIIFVPFIYGSENSFIGVTAIMAMAISYALGGLINQHVIFKKMHVTFEINIIQQQLASLLFLIGMSLSLETWPSWSSLLNVKILLSFLYLGVLATALAWIIYLYLLKKWGAVRTASVMYIVPALAILWDLLFLKLIPTSADLIGLAAILSGVILIQWTRKPTIS